MDYRYNAAAAERMREKRQKLKIMQVKMDIQRPTRAKEQLKLKTREAWKMNRQKSRANMSKQKRAAILKKRREYYQHKKLSKRDPLHQVNDGGYNNIAKSNVAMRKAVYRLKKKMPDDPENYVRLVQGLIKTASPRKRKLFREKGLQQENSQHTVEIQNVIQTLKTKNDKASRLARRSLIHGILATKSESRNGHKSLARSLGIQWKYMRSCTRSYLQEEEVGRNRNKTHEKALQQKDSLDRFFERQSIELPGLKTVSKRTGKQKKLLDRPLKQVYQTYKEMSTGTVAFSTFAKRRPRHIIPYAKTKMVGCLCEYCENVNIKLEVINRAAVGHPDCKIPDKYSMVEFTMCGRQEGHEYHSASCIRRQCDICGITKLKDRLSVITNDNHEQWTKWDNVKRASKDGNVVVKKELVTRTGTMKDVVAELLLEANSLAEHLFNSKWQYSQFLRVSETVPENTVVQVLDFAQNYRCDYQCEVQSSHYGYRQVTLHPVVSYYQCSECTQVVREDMVFLTDVLEHNAAAVKKFTELSLKHLRQDRNVATDKVIQFTDGCAQQYKCKTSFLHLSMTSGCSIERSYFGSRHGKGPADGCAGVVKSMVRTAVMAKKVTIQNAKQMFDYCKDNLTKDGEGCCHAKRTFFHVVTIPQASKMKLLPIKGTRAIHNVQATGKKGHVMVRNLSCYCTGCVNDEKCKNPTYIQNRRAACVTNSSRRTLMSTEKSTMSSQEASECKIEHQQGTNKTSITQDVTTCNQPGKTKKRQPSDTTDTSDNAQPSGPPTIIMHQVEGTELDLETAAHQTRSRTCQTRNEHRQRLSARTRPANLSIIRDDQKRKRNVVSKRSRSIAWSKIPDDKDERKEYYQRVLNVLSQLTDFTDLRQAIEGLPINSTLCVHETNITGSNHIVDRLSLELYPDDIPQNVLDGEQTYMPVVCTADGNCLAHCGTILSNASHEEMRTRIVAELVMHEDDYLSNHHLRNGTTISDKEANNLTTAYTMYSERYTQGDIITKAVVQRVYRKEVMSCCHLGTYMGIWQVFAMASVLCAPVLSIYPKKGNPVVRNHLHRLIIPRVDNTTSSKPVCIMWSSTRTDMVSNHWCPNHFVPVLPLIANDHIDFSAPQVDTQNVIDMTFEEWEQVDLAVYDVDVEQLEIDIKCLNDTACVTAREQPINMDDTTPDEDANMDNTTPGMEDAALDNTALIVEDATPENTVIVVEEAAPDNTAIVVEDAAPDNTAIVVKDAAPDNNAIVVEDAAPDNNAIVVEDTAPDNNAIVVEDAAQDNTATGMEDAAPDNTATGMEYAAPDNTATIVEDAAPDNTAPGMEDAAPDNTATVVEDAAPDNTVTGMEDAAPDNNAPGMEYAAPDNTATIVEDAAPDNTAPGMEDAAPDNTATVVEDAAPDNTATGMEDAAPDNTATGMEYAAPDNTATIVEIAAPDNTATGMEDAALDNTVTGMEDAPPDNTATIVEDAAPDNTAPGMEDAAPDNTATVVEDAAPGNTATGMEDAAPDNNVPGMEDAAPDNTALGMGDAAPDNTATVVEDAAPDNTATSMEDAAPDNTATGMEYAAPDDTATALGMEDAAPDNTATVVEDAAPDNTATSMEDAAPDNTATGMAYAAPDNTATVVEDAAPDNTAPGMEDAAPDNTATIVEDAAQGNTATGMEDAAPDNTATVVEDAAPDNTATGMEDAAPDNTATIVEDAAPENTAPGMEDATPDNTATGMEDAASDNTAPGIGDPAPDNTATMVEDAAPDNSALIVENSAPDNTATVVEEAAPDNTATVVRDASPDETATGMEDAAPDETATVVEDATPDNTATLDKHSMGFATATTAKHPLKLSMVGGASTYMNLHDR